MARGHVKATSLNIRDQAGNNATVIATAIQGTVVDVISASDDESWIMGTAVVDGHLRIGWMQAQFITLEGTSNPPPEAPVASAATNPNYPGFLFTALVPGGFYSAEPDNLKIPRAIRTNNPGALNDSSWQHARPGYVGKTFADFAGNKTAIYSAPEYGVASWYVLLAERYGFQTAGEFTLERLARAYAGSHAPASAVNTYINGWSKLANPPLAAASVIHLADEAEMLNLARAMFKHESSKVKMSDDQIRFAVSHQRANTLPPPPKP